MWTTDSDEMDSLDGAVEHRGFVASCLPPTHARRNSAVYVLFQAAGNNRGP